jgi:hypothetical protein
MPAVAAAELGWSAFENSDFDASLARAQSSAHCSVAPAYDDDIGLEGVHFASI